jgi:hypothetical protein
MHAESRTASNIKTAMEARDTPAGLRPIEEAMPREFRV